VSARNAVHDVVYDDLVANSGLRAVPEINVDQLEEADVEWLIDSLDEYGLWGEHAGRTRAEKRYFLSYDCSSQMHAFLIKVLSSPDIGKRINRIVEELSSSISDYRILLSALILNLLNFGVSIEMLTDIWGLEAINSPGFRRDRTMREFIDFASNRVLIKSSVASQYLLSQSADASSIVGVLIQMARRVSEGARASRLYSALFKSLMRFSSLQLVLPEANRRNAIITYYESIKNLAACKTNPLFWLQYAIATLVTEDLTRSRRYFDTAYSLALDQEFDTFQIDNHYARYLLVAAVNDTATSDIMDNFRQARDIIYRQVLDERRHHPYRVAIMFQSFVDRFGSTLGKDNLDELTQAASRILERIKQLPSQRQRHRHVADCAKAMEYVLARTKHLLQPDKEGAPA
jgi:hypothetical protein